MSRYRFELATPADDADLRRILAATPMAGRIAVSFRREPSYFEASGVDGRFCQVVAARDGNDGRLVGFGARAIRQLHVNGKPEAIGYLSSLRLLAEHRNQGLVARGYAFFRKLHADGTTRLYLTTIAEGNELALSQLTSGRAGLPPYHSAGSFLTAALPLGHAVLRRCDTALEIRSATMADLPIVLAFLDKEGPRRQFFPCYQPDDFFNDGGGAFRDLHAADLLLAFRGGELVGTLAGWDQHGFRQTVVHGYAPPWSWARPFYNGWARFRGRPRLPAAGECLRYLTAALPVVAGDDPAVFTALLDALCVRAAGGPWQYLLLGLHENDPLLEVVRRRRPICYATRLYLVCWEDGDALRRSLDGRVPYLELGSL